MKNILQALILFVLVGFSTNSHSQVILNGGSFEAIIIDSDYTVPDGKILIIMHRDVTNGTCLMNGKGFTSGGQGIPLPAGSEITSPYDDWIGDNGDGDWLSGYLIDMEEWGATSDVPDDEIIDNDGGEIEIYPNPTDDLASVFVDYQGDWNMTVYDLNGQIVFECQSDTPVKSIDTNSLSAGTYIVSVRAKRKLIGSSQLIVQ